MSDSPFPFSVPGRIKPFATEHDVRNAAYAQAEFSNKLREWLTEPAQAAFKAAMNLPPIIYNLQSIVVWDVLDTCGAYSIESTNGTRYTELITAPEALPLRLDSQRVELWKGTWEKLRHPRSPGERLNLFLNACNRTGLGLANHWYLAIENGKRTAAFNPHVPDPEPEETNWIVVDKDNPMPPFDLEAELP